MEKSQTISASWALRRRRAGFYLTFNLAEKLSSFVWTVHEGARTFDTFSRVKKERCF
jgi:hypothetical protein